MVLCGRIEASEEAVLAICSQNDHTHRSLFIPSGPLAEAKSKSQMLLILDAAVCAAMLVSQQL